MLTRCINKFTEHIFSLSDSLYGPKYAFIQNIANAYVEKHKLYNHPGNIVHVVNELTHEVSKIFGVEPIQDLFARYRDLSDVSTQTFERHTEFAIYLLDYLSGREGAYRFVEFLAQYYAGKLPDSSVMRLKLKKGSIIQRLLKS